MAPLTGVTTNPACPEDPNCRQMKPVEPHTPTVRRVAIPGQRPRLNAMPGAWRFWCEVHHESTTMEDAPTDQVAERS
ncbi:hypothetical protein GCM10009733_108940 [Nonomuraea maheshkhaliensis]|uniref:Uncharacterized protein n=1 Tax=Nonomuraea maheshkhaliensis TaxID=419590 RepID=A0ABN2HYA4_9ACTN